MLDSIIGHATQIELLRQTLSSRRVAGAYLFAGLPNLGKKTAAEAFAAALNCEQQGDDACGECGFCRRAADGNHPDIRFVRPDGATFRIDQVREVRRQIALQPMEGRYKVYVLTDVEKMRQEAANALLKTLEEPPGAGVLILTTTNLNGLLPTIRSRCQVVKFLPMPADALASELVARGADAGFAADLSQRSGGRIGLALDAMEDETARDDAIPDVLRGMSPIDAFRLAETWRKEPESLDRLLTWYRDLMLLRIGANADALSHRRAAATLHLLARRESYPSLRRKMRAIVEAQFRLRRNMNAALTLESLAFELMRSPLSEAS